MRSRWIVLRLALVAVGLVNSSCHDDPIGPLPPSTPPTATFVPLVSLPGSMAYGEPWSPDGARLAYADAASDSIAVFDVLTPETSPRPVVALGGFVSEIRWSPDGGWLLLVRNDGWPTFVRHLIAARVPRSGVPGVVVEVAPPNTEISHAAWGSDGNIYWWDIGTGKRTPRPPPAEWRSENPAPFAERPQLLPRRNPHTGTLAPFVFETVSVVVETPIDVLADTTMGHVLGVDVVPEGREFLLDILAAPCTFTARVDRSGAILTRYFTPCGNGPAGGPYTYERGMSVSADRRFVLGYREVEDGNHILSSQLILTDLQASWVVELEGTAMGLWDAGFAATGLFMAYGDLRGGVKVGVLDVWY